MFLTLGLFVAALASGWWAVIRGPDLLARSDNPRRIIEDRYVPRGMLLDRTNTQINSTEGKTSTYTRVYKYPDLSTVVGYNHPIYGQSGLEASLDEYLRGLRGNPTATIWWNHLLYGMAPKGLDVRLSLDLYLQFRADEMMTGQRGTVILLNAQTGEIYVMSSHPTFDPSRLDEIGKKPQYRPRQTVDQSCHPGTLPLGTMPGAICTGTPGRQNFHA